jgi:hypothetical protein
LMIQAQRRIKFNRGWKSLSKLHSAMRRTWGQQRAEFERTYITPWLPNS